MIVSLLTVFSVAPPPVLELPIDCELGRDCLIQQYVDHDHGPGTEDYRCGAQVYDGHKGTDFRISDLAAMRAGVPVLASAKGRVKAVRDGEPDTFPKNLEADDLEGRECGNGVLVDHGEGWETQYCHLREGSVSVGPGMAVEAGQAIGLVGMSGKAQFPHVHLSVRQDGKVVDPFSVGGPACGSAPEAIWSSSALKQAPYEDTRLFGVGFAEGTVSTDDIEEGRLAFEPTVHSPALVVYGRMVNVKEGDRLRMTLKGPGGVIVENESDPAPRHQAQRMAFAGKRRPESGWPAGDYRGVVEVVRGGDVIDRQDVSLRIE